MSDDDNEIGMVGDVDWEATAEVRQAELTALRTKLEAVEGLLEDGTKGMAALNGEIENQRQALREVEAERDRLRDLFEVEVDHKVAWQARAEAAETALAALAETHAGCYGWKETAERLQGELADATAEWRGQDEAWFADLTAARAEVAAVKRLITRHSDSKFAPAAHPTSENGQCPSCYSEGYEDGETAARADAERLAEALRWALQMISLALPPTVALSFELARDKARAALAAHEAGPGEKEDSERE